MSEDAEVISLASRRPAPAAQRYAAGQVILGKYRLETVLGQGGMGAVWLAKNLTLDVDVAIKLIHADVASPVASQRLLVEARSAARLEHPAIVRVFDFGETEHGDPFIVMEVVRGESLGEVLERKGRVPAPMAVQLLLPIIDALSVAHGRGIIHRDVKPDNIILMTGDKGAMSPKLVDFGIAKDAPRDGPIPLALADSRPRRPLTVAGSVVGSPEYMSPEQSMANGAVDLRSDIWSVCIVLYEAMCGTRPFQGDDFTKLAIAINVDPATPITEHGAGDEQLWQILERGLGKDRRERWSTMRAMGCALAAWLWQRGVHTDVNGASLAAHWLGDGLPASLSVPPAAIQPAPTPPRWPLALAAGVGVLALGGAALWASLAARDARAARVTEARSPVSLTAAAAPATPSAAAPSAAPSDRAPVTATTRSPTHAPKREQAAPDDPGF